MKNVNYVLGNYQNKLKGKHIILFALILLATKSYSQTYNEIFNDAKDDWINNSNWVFSLDDNCNQQYEHGAFSWCVNGGRRLEDVMMTLRKADETLMTSSDRFELKVAGSLILKNRDTRMADWDNLKLWTDSFKSYIESNGDDNGMFISSNLGNKIQLGDSNDAITINGKYVIMDYGGANDVAQVAINAGNPVNGAVLTVGGMTYIGSSKNIEANPGLADDLKADCSLIVEKQVLASDLNIIPKPHWRDFVFENDYKKMDLKALEGYVKENKHLPGIVSEKEVKEKGYKIHVFNEGLLQNVEELLLHIIDQNKKIEELNKRIEALEK
ncbi:hypothetical protein [Flavobacterium tructae]|uniref:hypothetical protein n=1 Tax=Flavobacterium tructae TaxID=1114873 RepID=UPI0035A8CD60